MTNLEELRGRIAAVREEIRTETAELKDSKAVYEIKKAFRNKKLRGVSCRDTPLILQIPWSKLIRP